ncbi:hypothetical protein FQA47_024464 [Oryzias melastigma]|uniref:Uncharacterized protein n=1 Tax=Oryzias melastigma TaxID=30732 RepID=A0A834F1B9_ORYME|nr:hypothetical protein FQA47_024464 [Oryzias melastigma]
MDTRGSHIRLLVIFLPIIIITFKQHHPVIFLMKIWRLTPTNSRSDTSLISNDVRQRALLSSWARKYFVVDIPPYCGQRGGDDDGEDEGKEGNKEDVSGESWSPIIISSETDSGEAMDCSSSREEEEELQRRTGGVSNVTPRRTTGTGENSCLRE